MNFGHAMQFPFFCFYFSRYNFVIATKKVFFFFKDKKIRLTADMVLAIIIGSGFKFLIDPFRFSLRVWRKSKAHFSFLLPRLLLKTLSSLVFANVKAS